MFETLKKIANESIKQNCLTSLEGPVIPAGGHQFKTLWTRDFCYSVPGLLTSGHSELVQNQLEVILRRLRPEDNLLPRGVDPIPPQLRVALHTAGRWIPGRDQFSGYSRPLKAEYLGEHGTVAFDSNLLTLIASAQYGKNNPAWLKKHISTFEKVLCFYNGFFQNELLHQPPFSDWQDSAQRVGATFYSQILYCKTLLLFDGLGVKLQSPVVISDFISNIHRNFYNPEIGLYTTSPGSEQVPLESNLWAIEMNLFNTFVSSSDLYNNLKKHPVWQSAGLPGIPIFPRYTSNEVSWTCKSVGLKGYHDSFLWSWLIAESARIAILQNDISTAEDILSWLEARVQQDGAVYEIYQSRGLRTAEPFKSFLYKSESPFTWGAAKTLEALSTYK